MQWWAMIAESCLPWQIWSLPVIEGFVVDSLMRAEASKILKVHNLRRKETRPTARPVDPRRRAVGVVWRCIPFDASAVDGERTSRTERRVLPGEAGYIPDWSMSVSCLCHFVTQNTTVKKGDYDPWAASSPGDL